MRSLLFAFLTLVALASSQIIAFDCNRMPETCNNMCFASNNRPYNQMHYDPVVGNRRGRRQAARCVPHPNRCRTAPPTPVRITCDEYPFASTYGILPGGWWAGIGATTRCVSWPECRSQGGTLSAFYRSFGYAAGTPIGVTIFNIAVAPYCTNPLLAPDADFRVGVMPPTLQESEREQLNLQAPNKLLKYKTSNHTIYSLGGAALKKGSKVFFAKDWQKLVEELELFDEEDDCCCGTDAQKKAADKLPVPSLGWYEAIVA